MPNEDSPIEVMDTSVDSVEQNGDGKPAEHVERMEVMEIPPEKTAEEFKNAGNAEYLKKNYEAAAELYSNAIDHNPIAAYYGNRAAAYVMLGNYPKALEDARRSTQIDPMFIKGYLREAKCQLALGEIAAAVHLYEKILEKDSGNSTALAEHKQAKHIQELLSKAEASYLKCDFRTVLYNTDRCIEMCPDCLKFKSLKAECLALLERYDESQKLASDILRLDGLCADAIYVRGICFYYTDNQDKAFQHFQQVLRLAPDHTKAREVYKKAKNLISKKEEGNKAFKKGKYDEATTLYSEGLLIDPLNKATNAKLYYNLATVKQKTGKLEEAITYCSEAIKLNDKYTNAYLKRGKCYMDLEQYKEAVREFETLFKFEKTHDVKMHLQKAKLELKKSKRKDYYKMLDIGKNATDDEIKKAYRKHALLHHPDRHSGAAEDVKKSEEKKFKEIGEAYAVLSDPKKKSLYDSGQDLDEINGGGAGFDPTGFDPNIIFQSFFANGGGGQRRRGGGQSAGGFPSDGFPGFPGGFTFQFG